MERSTESGATMRWASTVATASDLEAAIREASRTISAALDDRPADLGVVFVSEQHARNYEHVPGLVMQYLGPRVLVGCAAGGVIGGGREIEGAAGVSLSAAVMPDVRLMPFRVAADACPGAEADAAVWQTAVEVAAAEAPHFLLLPDPFTFPAEQFVHGLDRVFPGATIIGGLASGARAPGANALFLGTDVHRSGLVGVALSGNVVIDTIVAQGCRPIGEPMFVTRADGNVILELDGARPLGILRDLLQAASDRDRALFRNSLFVGLVMKQQSEYHQGDFLIRNLVGIDGERGAIAVGAAVTSGLVVQFHLRDSETSADDLEALLVRSTSRPVGSLLFSCLGRGADLYGHANHDSHAFGKRFGDVPIGGFFCNGEIGPVQGTTFLHGYTSAFGLFRARS